MRECERERERERARESERAGERLGGRERARRREPCRADLLLRGPAHRVVVHAPRARAHGERHPARGRVNEAGSCGGLAAALAWPRKTGSAPRAPPFFLGGSMIRTQRCPREKDCSTDGRARPNRPARRRRRPARFASSSEPAPPQAWSASSRSPRAPPRRARSRASPGGVTHTAPSKYHDKIISLAFIHTKSGEPIHVVIMVFRRTIQKVRCLSPPRFNCINCIDQSQYSRYTFI